MIDLHRIVTKLKALLLILFLLLTILHFIVKDRFHYISVLFYACPLPLIVLFGLLVALLFFKQKKLFYGLLTVLFALNIYFFTHYFGSAYTDTTYTKTSHILFWNAAKNQPLPTDILIKHIQQSNPEIIALVEALDVSDKDLNLLKTACPEYHFQPLRGEMLIGVKGRVDSIVFKSNVDVYRYNCMLVTINDVTTSLMIADVYAYPFENKETALNAIKEAAKKYKVSILVGDFNTPYESVYFNDFKDDFNSFHPYSIGMSSTWPVPFPVIEIDQIWLGKSFQPIKMEKYSYKLSDHKLLLGEYK